jgi:nicotinate dehydrogenase subunit B
MADVVASLGPLPDSDIRAMAVYLASLAGDAPAPRPATAAAAAPPPGAATLFQGACASCHEGGAGGELVPLGLVTAVHSAHPDNLIQAVLNGIPAAAERFPAPDPSAPPAAMPAFRDSLTDRQVADIVAYTRARYAPDAPAWPGLEAAVARVRGLKPHAGGRGHPGCFRDANATGRSDRVTPGPGECGRPSASSSPT